MLRIINILDVFVIHFCPAKRAILVNKPYTDDALEKCAKIFIKDGLTPEVEEFMKTIKQWGKKVDRRFNKEFLDKVQELRSEGH